jgi:hypothetical protein
MKKYLLIAMLFTCCKKPIADTKNLTTLTVMDSVDGIPVVEAEVVMSRCNYGCPFGATILFKGNTDNSGRVDVPSAVFSDQSTLLNVVKPNYFPFLTQQMGTSLTLRPKGWIQLHIVRVGNYPQGCTLQLDITDQTTRLSDETFYPAAKDSLIVVEAFGGRANEVAWKILDANNQDMKEGKMNLLQIAKFDTLKNVVLNY